MKIYIRFSPIYLPGFVQGIFSQEIVFRDFEGLQMPLLVCSLCTRVGKFYDFRCLLLCVSIALFLAPVAVTGSSDVESARDTLAAMATDEQTGMVFAVRCICYLPYLTFAHVGSPFRGSSIIAVSPIPSGIRLS